MFGFFPFASFNFLLQYIGVNRWTAPLSNTIIKSFPFLLVFYFIRELVVFILASNLDKHANVVDNEEVMELYKLPKLSSTIFFRIWELFNLVIVKTIRDVVFTTHNSVLVSVAIYGLNNIQ